MRYAVNAKAVYSLPEESPDQRLDFHLDNWKRWMKSDVITDGLPNRGAGCIGGGYSRDVDDMLSTLDIRCAMATDALIRDLTAPQQAAIHHAYLRAAYRFRDFGKTLEGARRALKSALELRGIY